MAQETFIMSHKEMDRLSLIQSIIDKKLTQISAASQMGISVRQVKRLVAAFRKQGAQGLISKHRGKKSNNAISGAVRKQAISLIRTHYADFGPTFAHEKLTEQHQLHFSVETLRKWMTQESIWQTKARRKLTVHQCRPRRSRFGELIQIDGSPHDWFEGRAPKCTLIVFIDDATSQLTALRFAPSETTQVYMETFAHHLKQHGRPAAIYSDKHSIFRVNHKDHQGKRTQFSRALSTLDIESIQANTPQAKGRVERANLTLQDRLVKEMRLLKINSMKEANTFLPIFIDDYNKRFAVEAQSPEDAHRAVLHDRDELDLIFRLHQTRKLSKNLSFQFKNTEYQITGKGQGYRLRGALVTVCESFNNNVKILHKGRTLSYRTLKKGEKPMPVISEKEIQAQVDLALRKQSLNPIKKPAPDHPWRNYPE